MATAFMDSMCSKLLRLRPSRTQCSKSDARAFTTSLKCSSGHNKWSKIKHDKGRKDQAKTVLRTQYVQAITMNSRLYGPDLKMNSGLAHAIALAKKSSVPKEVIDQAVARGQGRSLSGVALETMKFEFIMPPSAAMLVTVETDNKLRALQDVNGVIRKYKGRITSTEFFFSRIGRVVFERHETLGVDDILDEAIEAGAEDVEADEEGNLMVVCQPTQTTQIAQSLAKKFELKILSSDITWSVKEETQSTVDRIEDVEQLSAVVDALTEMPEVQEIYCNAVKGEELPEEKWATFAESIDS